MGRGDVGASHHCHAVRQDVRTKTRTRGRLVRRGVRWVLRRQGVASVMLQASQRWRCCTRVDVIAASLSIRYACRQDGMRLAPPLCAGTVIILADPAALLQSVQS